MSATNATTNYELPVFIATDKPAWLVDWNGAMNAIDSAIKEAKTAGDNAQSTANTNAQNIATLDGTVTSQGTAIGNLQTAVSGNTGSINTINSLIGNGEPTTTDKTIIGAINEINAKVGDVDAEDVDYDNTTSGLSATNVQAAIDEVAAGAVTPDAEDVDYDNTTSGLTATNVQAAIDELASSGPSGADHGVYELWKNSDVTADFASQNVVLSDFDSTKYDAIVVAMEVYKGEGSGAIWREFDKDVLSITSYTAHLDNMAIGSSSGKIQRVDRPFTITLTGTTLTLAFSDATSYTYNTYGAAPDAGTTTNAACIPVRILGLAHNA